MSLVKWLKSKRKRKAKSKENALSNSGTENSAKKKKKKLRSSASWRSFLACGHAAEAAERRKQLERKQQNIICAKKSEKFSAL
jgi:hypothetical protein